MKKLLISILLSFNCLFVFSQTQTLQVIYITKDYTTEVNPLCQELRDIYSFAEKERSQAVVFYLANAASPLIVKMNLPGDNRKDFDSIIDALMTKSETIINVSADLDGIVSLFNDIELLDSIYFTLLSLYYISI